MSPPPETDMTPQERKTSEREQEEEIAPPSPPSGGGLASTDLGDWNPPGDSVASVEFCRVVVREAILLSETNAAYRRIGVLHHREQIWYLMALDEDGRRVHQVSWCNYVEAWQHPYIRDEVDPARWREVFHFIMSAGEDDAIAFVASEIAIMNKTRSLIWRQIRSDKVQLEKDVSQRTPAKDLMDVWNTKPDELFAALKKIWPNLRRRKLAVAVKSILDSDLEHFKYTSPAKTQMKAGGYLQAVNDEAAGLKAVNDQVIP